MAISLEELKRQREQIRKHLEWLDFKIEELVPESKAPAKKEPLSRPEPEGTSPDSPSPTPENAATATEEIHQSNAEALSPEIDGSTYRAKTQSELMRAKIGCVVFFILGIALFLFLLFGLPYLL